MVIMTAILLQQRVLEVALSYLSLSLVLKPLLTKLRNQPTNQKIRILRTALIILTFKSLMISLNRHSVLYFMDFIRQMLFVLH